MAPLRGAPWLSVLAVAAYVVVAGAVVAAVVWSSLAADGRTMLAEALGNQVAALSAMVLLAVAGLAALVAHLVGRYVTGVRRLTGETRLLLDANPNHPVERSGPPELVELATAVDDLAERRRVAEGEVEAQIAEASAGLEQERNRLATLMAELAVAVIVCNVDGRILLYNAAARTMLDDEAAVGIGRSVFAIVDRDLLEHAVARLEGRKASSHVATTVRDGRALQVQVATVPGPDSVAGYVLLLEDLTDRMAASGRRNDLLREFAESTRASLGSIRAAIETVIDYPEMEAEERHQFTMIVREEAQRLGEQVERWAAESGEFLAADWPLTDISTADLVSLVAASVEGACGMTVWVSPPAEPLWVKADSHALARSFVHLVDRLRARDGVEAVTLTVSRAGGYAQLEVAWPGVPPAPEEFQGWVEEQLTGGAAPDVQEVVSRHGGELWSGGTAAEASHVRLLLPLTAASEEDPGTVPDVRPERQADSRPEFYDFDLLDRQAESREDWHDRRLNELSYTVFDTETTGLQPAEGDEIISVGAVRVVNNRLLRQESFERLVDPQRGVPKASTAIHGLTAAMLAGKPTIDKVLPEFERYAADTVLVGHNVGFDFQFLRRKEERTGVRFTQPVLDTLLLDAVVHPDHEEHSLEAIADRLGVEIVGRHSALGDALVTGQVFLHLLPLLERRGLHTLGEVLEASRATLQGRLGQKMYES